MNSIKIAQLDFMAAYIDKNFIMSRMDLSITLIGTWSFRFIGDLLLMEPLLSIYIYQRFKNRTTISCQKHLKLINASIAIDMHRDY